MKKILGNTFLILFSIFFSLLLAEILVRFVFPQDLSGTWRTVSHNGYLLNKASAKARHQKGERVVYYNFNSLHLRSREINFSKKRVLIFGDSFTFGWLLDEKDTYINILQQYVNDSIDANIQLINAGAGGWGTADFYDYLSEFGDSIQPDLIIIFMNSDDIGRSLNRHKFFTVKDNFTQIKIFVANSITYSWLLEHSHFVQLIRKNFVNAQVPKRVEKKNKKENIVVPSSEVSPELLSKAISVGNEIFSGINKWSIQRNIQVVVTTTGWIFNSAGSEPTLEFLSKADSVFTALQIPFYEITPEINKRMGNRFSDFIIKGDNHPNEAGAKLIADVSWNVLKKHFMEIKTVEEKNNKQ